MSNTENANEPEVKDVERVEIAPAGDDSETVEPESETQPESSQEETKDDEGTEETADTASEESEAEEPEKDPELKQPTAAKDTSGNPDNLQRVATETSREFALRLEVTRLKKLGAKERSGEIMTPAPATNAKKELTPEKQKVLAQYKPEDITKLKEVFDVLAEDMGFVRSEQLNATTFQTQASEVLDDFLEKHPEYLPENDAGNVLWDRFKSEYGLYKSPAHPKDVKKLLDKVHREVFGIKPAAALKTDKAAQEKLKVASHSGTSRPSPSREGVKRDAAPQGLRVDMLKGFSDEEKAELLGE